MNISRITLPVLTALVLTIPLARASTVTFTVSDDLGPVITSDPLGLNGSPFTLTGTVTQGPSGQLVYTADSLSVTATALGITETLAACGTSGAPAACGSDTTPPMLTLTTDSATLVFDVSVLGVGARLTRIPKSERDHYVMP